MCAIPRSYPLKTKCPTLYFLSLFPSQHGMSHGDKTTSTMRCRHHPSGGQSKERETPASQDDVRDYGKCLPGTSCPHRDGEMRKKKLSILFEPLDLGVAMIQPLSWSQRWRESMFLCEWEESSQVLNMKIRNCFTMSISCLAPRPLSLQSAHPYVQYHQCGSYWGAHSKVPDNIFNLNDFASKQSEKAELFDNSC